MGLEIIESKGLSHKSYYLSDENEAIVIDPRRDCGIYKQLSDSDCAKIVYIFETHKNEDYVIGSIELENMTNAEICHSKESNFAYGQHKLEDEEHFQIGTLDIKVIYTPGHTNDSLCFAVSSIRSKDTPLMVFTGDTLFAGDVGRTDLLGIENQREQSNRLFDSLHNKLRPLGKHVQVYPAHGGGSICGHNISDRQNTTIGYEWNINQILKINRNEFVETLLQQKIPKPPYFKQMEILNLKGPPIIEDLPETFFMDVKDFARASEAYDSVILDTREVGAFAACHIPNSINIWLDGVSYFSGWILSFENNILLLTENKSDIEIARKYLLRLGFDNILGCLCAGIKSWRNMGKEIEHFGTMSAMELAKKINDNKITLLDVRSKEEYDEEHIKGAVNIYVGNLEDSLATLDKRKPLVVMCSVGDRGGIGASILKNAGFSEVYNVLGGLEAWKNLDFPVEK